MVAESDGALRELADLGFEHGQLALTYSSVTDRLKSLEAEIAELQRKIDQARTAESATQSAAISCAVSRRR